MKKDIICIDEDKCVGCNRCIAVCPVHEANTAININGKNIIRLNSEKCIRCGNCIKSCSHSARYYVDDTVDFFNDIENGEKISLIAAPSVRYNFDKWKKLFGYMKKIGVKNIYDVSLGADITTWAYIKAIETKHLDSIIAQPCPVIVNYLEKYLPDALKKISPIQSPMMCLAIYLKKYLKIKEKIAFLSPCIGKYDEINDPNTFGLVSYNVTYKRLKDYFKEHNIDTDHFKEADFDNTPSCGIGLTYSRPGGLKENIEHIVGKNKFWIRQIEGTENVYKYLSEYNTRLNDHQRLPHIIDVLNCENGCNLGTATNSYLMSDDINFKMDNYKKIAERNNRQKRLFKKDLYSPFEWCEKNLKLSDFFREYTDKSENCKHSIPSYAELQNLYSKMHKKTLADQRINCSACGYESCEAFAIAVFNNNNHPSNCINYSRKELEINHILQKEKEEKLLQEKKKSLLALADKFELKIGSIINILTKSAHNMENTSEEMQEVSKIAVEKAKSGTAAADEVSQNVDTIAAATKELSISITEIAQQVSILSNAANNVSAKLGINTEKQIVDTDNNKVDKTVNTIITIISAIAAAVEQQEYATAEISRNINEAADDTRKVSSDINGINLAIQNANNQSNSVKEASENLMLQGETLRKEVDIFLKSIRSGTPIND